MNFSYIFKNYNLSIVLFALFFASWVGQFLFQIPELANEAAQHGQAFQWS